MTVLYNGSVGLRKFTVMVKRETRLVLGVKKGAESSWVYVKRVSLAWME